VAAVPSLQRTAATVADEHRGVAMAVVAIVHSRRGPSEVLRALLVAEGYEVVSILVRRALTEELSAIAPDVVVVDCTSADFDVVRLCRDVRRSVDSRVVVVPPPAADEAWTMEVLRAGADDVLDHGSSEAMIRTRMMAIVRTGPVRERGPGRLVVGDVIVDLDGFSVVIDGDVVPFPMRLFRTLVELARRPNVVVTWEQLLSDVWGVDPRPAHRRRLRVAVSSLRRLLGQGAQRPRIETVVRVGYRLSTVALTGPTA
jgi:DNA-binding response OmpR family regulator